MKKPEITKEWLMAHGGIVNEIKCGVCGQPFLDGMGYHPGRMLRGYGLYCCKTCFEGNWDGWAPHYEKAILAHLEKKGIKIPPRNENGWLPIEF